MPPTSMTPGRTCGCQGPASWSPGAGAGRCSSGAPSWWSGALRQTGPWLPGGRILFTYYHQDSDSWEMLEQRLDDPDVVMMALFVPEDFVIDCS